MSSASQGELPWQLSDDLKRFKALTMGKPIVMGRLTCESIGRALPGRQNIVITRQADYRRDGCDVVASMRRRWRRPAMRRNHDYWRRPDLRSIPAESGALLRDARAYEIDGDTFFPRSMQDWRASRTEAHAAAMPTITTLRS